MAARGASHACRLPFDARKTTVPPEPRSLPRVQSDLRQKRSHVGDLIVPVPVPVPVPDSSRGEERARARARARARKDRTPNNVDTRRLGSVSW